MHLENQATAQQELTGDPSLIISRQQAARPPVMALQYLGPGSCPVPS